MNSFHSESFLIELWLTDILKGDVQRGLNWTLPEDRVGQDLMQRPEGLVVVGKSLLGLTLCGPMDCSPPGSSVLCYLPEFAQVHVHRVGDAI